MNARLLPTLFALVCLLMIPGRIFGHHSDSVYDQEHLTTITGTVTQFEFVNPHQLIHLDVKDPGGKVEQWVVLGGAPNQMRRLGWNSESVKPGEQLTVTGFRFRDGRSVMLHLKIVRANGDELRLSDVEAIIL